jgi:hypothetical protein
MSTAHQFTHTFRNGATCTFVFEPSAHYDPATRQIFPAKHWSSSPTDEEAEALYPEYLEWAHSVHSEIAEIIMDECTYLIQDSYASPPTWEFWVYRPGGQKECVKRGFGRFDPRWIGRRGYDTTDE